MTKRNNIVFHIAALFMVVVWGGSFINTKVLLNNGLQPVEIYLCRFLIAYSCLLLASRKRLFASNIKDELFLALAGITGGSFYFIAENTALQLTLVSDVAIIVATTPLITSFLVKALYKDEVFDLPTFIGSLVAIIGVILVVFNGKVAIGSNIVGDSLAFVAALSWAFYSIILKKLYARYDSAFITRKVFFYGLVTAAPCVLFRDNSFDFALFEQKAVYINIIYLGIIASMLCFLLWSITVRKIGAIRASNYLYFGPVISLAASAFFLNEIISASAYFGAALVIIGLLIAERNIREPLKHRLSLFFRH